SPWSDVTLLPTLKIFLMALAIIDDLGALIIIALFYTNDLSMASLGVAAVAIAVLAVLNYEGIPHLLTDVVTDMKDAA
ncbi:Na+/H+ antiporter NhaA, partial [Escherichia coli]|nr:Na+/H+ antiporter NhaA [Escherichia coli]